MGPAIEMSQFFHPPAASQKKKRHENFARGFPREDLRSSLVPAARGWTLSDLMKEVDDYGEATGNKVRWMAFWVDEKFMDFFFERGDWIERKGRTNRKDRKESDKSKKTQKKKW